MNIFQRKSWSPYVVGVGIGVLSWFAFRTADHPIGVTTPFEHTAALVGAAVTPGGQPGHGYYTAPENKPVIGWEWMLVVGLFLGALASSMLSGDREGVRVPRLWGWRFGADPRFRYAAAFGGGALMMFGARLARGCTSGHAISGSLQLALSSWVFALVIFAVAVGAAHLIYGREGARHV